MSECQLLCLLTDGLVECHDLFNHIRSFFKAGDKSSDSFFRVFFAYQCHTGCNQIQNGQLNHIRLRTGDCNLRTCMCIENVITFPGNGGTLYINNGKNLASAFLCQTESCQCINGLSGLGYNNYKRMLIHERRVVTKL